MRTHYTVVIAGAGPGGLSAAKHLAKNGCRVAVLEQKSTIGDKVCAGGITWSGLISRVPDHLIQQSFPEQFLSSPLQRVVVRSDNPIIATVNRRELGQWMAAEAANAGADIIPEARVQNFTGRTVQFTYKGSPRKLVCDYLVGADGANSRVRRLLGLGTRRRGLGLNCQIPGQRHTMCWHLERRLFATGYGWIFPHRNTFSIGAYADSSLFDFRTLKTRLFQWAEQRGVTMTAGHLRAGLVNYDYQGHSFNNIFLVGDAAGLASGLTGEGIYPAIVAGEEVARHICGATQLSPAMRHLLARHRRHTRLLELATRTGPGCSVLMELSLLLLRWKFLDFTSMEMAK
ncbi:MAG: monooxygenase [Desulfobulbus propionicus]|nr:MAG: monooxygenase [Desulfobulbus propionicus]